MAKRRSRVRILAAGWCICTRGGKRYIPRAYETREQAEEVMEDLLKPYSPTSPWRTLCVELRGKDRPTLMPESP